MTQVFFPSFAHYIPVPAGFALADPDTSKLRTKATDFATIKVGAWMHAQGPVLRRFRDGRVTIDAAGRQMTGQPVGGRVSRGWFGNLLRRV